VGQGGLLIKGEQRVTSSTKLQQRNV